jgi:CheY-like chemotaxis protein
VLYSFRDISELKRHAQELAAAKETAERDFREKERLLDLLARELRTPLTPILTLAHQLARDARVPQDLQGDIEMISRNVENQVHLLDQALTNAGRIQATAPGDVLQPPPPPASAAAPRLRILLVEDHHDTARVVARVLEAFGHTVTIAGSIASASEALHRQMFDFLICDLGLPDGSGHDLMRRLPSPLPAIAFSGFSSEDDVQRSLQAGFLEHLVKPIDAQVLVDTIERLAARR